MNPNRSKETAPRAGPRDLRRWLPDSLADRGKWLVARGGLIVAAGVTLAIGLRLLERCVRTLPPYDGTLTLQWEELPDWVRHPANRHLLDRLTETAGLSIDDRFWTRDLARTIADRLSETRNAWIERLERVELRPGGIVAVRCRFRRPVAWVLSGGQYYLLGDDGRRLPGRFDEETAQRTGFMVIEGATAAVPAVGRLWPGADLRAGLRIAGACSQRPFREQITRVVVANHSGRINRLRPQIELITNRPGTRIGWGRPPGEEDGCEITAEQKLALLESLYRREGRIDMDRSYIDVTTWSDRIATPQDQTAALPQTGRRG